MKKVLSLSLAAMMAVSLTACGGSETKDTAADTSNETTAAADAGTEEGESQETEAAVDSDTIRRVSTERSTAGS